jgi:hypothetical protein
VLEVPAAFGIDLLIDDAEGVALEGKRFGFSVLHIKEDDLAWGASIESIAFGHASEVKHAAERSA